MAEQATTPIRSGVMHQLFSAHPESVGETYLQHLRTAAGFAGMLFTAAVACTFHALLPFLFEKTASSIIERLHERMVRHRDRRIAH